MGRALMACAKYESTRAVVDVHKRPRRLCNQLKGQEGFTRIRSAVCGIRAPYRCQSMDIYIPSAKKSRSDYCGRLSLKKVTKMKQKRKRQRKFTKKGKKYWQLENSLRFTTGSKSSFWNPRKDNGETYIPPVGDGEIKRSTR